jgi:hypothetical protein
MLDPENVRELENDRDLSSPFEPVSFLVLFSLSVTVIPVVKEKESVETNVRLAEN